MWTTRISKILRVPGSKSWESLTHPVHLYAVVGGGKAVRRMWGGGGHAVKVYRKEDNNGSQTNCASSKRIKAKVAITSNQERLVQKRRSDGKC